MFLGCRELKVINGLNVIVEGDSVLSIQWGSTSMPYPWWLTDWMEKIRSISSMKQFSFSHVYRESNMLANVLANDGAFHPSLVFDV